MFTVMIKLQSAQQFQLAYTAVNFFSLSLWILWVTQNYKMVCVGKGLKDHVVQIPQAMGRDTFH